MQTDRFGQILEVDDIVIFSTTGAMDEGTVHKLGKKYIIKIKNSSGYIKDKTTKDIINKTKLMELNPSLFL